MPTCSGVSMELKAPVLRGHTDSWEDWQHIILFNYILEFYRSIGRKKTVQVHGQ